MSCSHLVHRDLHLDLGPAGPALPLGPAAGLAKDRRQRLPQTQHLQEHMGEEHLQQADRHPGHWRGFGYTAQIQGSKVFPPPTALFLFVRIGRNKTVQFSTAPTRQPFRFKELRLRFGIKLALLSSTCRHRWASSTMNGCVH